MFHLKYIQLNLIDYIHLKHMPFTHLIKNTRKKEEKKNKNINQSINQYFISKYGF